MATIERRGAGQFRAIIRRKGYPPQRRTFKSRAAAEAWARAEEAAMDRCQWEDACEARRTTLADALDRYALEVTPLKRGAPQEQVRIRAWKTHALASRPLASIRGADLAAWRDARLKVAGANTVRLELAVLSHLFTVARTDWGMGVGNPARDVRLPPMPPGMDRRISREEERDLAAKLTSPTREAFTLALETAMRRGELAGLEWSRVELERRVVRLPRTKNGHPRDVPLSPRAVQVLKGMGQGSGHVFGTPAVAAEDFSRQVGEVARALGFAGVTFHTTRHEATSRLFERGLSIVEVATITGHRTLAMLRRYVHLRAEDLAAKLAA